MNDTSTPAVLAINISRIGDVVSSLVVVNYLRDRYGKVDFLVNEGYFPLLRSEPGIEPVSAQQALQRTYSLVVDLTSGKDSRRLVRKIRAREKLGFHRTWLHKLRLIGTYTATRRKRVVRGGTEQDHIMTGFYPLLEYLGTNQALRPVLHAGVPTPHAQQVIDDARRDRSALVAIHIGATNPKRQPPHELILGIIKHLQARNAGVILIGDETSIAERLVCESNGYARHFMGDLNELKFVLAHVDLFIGPCSGPLHMTAALQRPAIGLYGPTVPRISAPVSDLLTVVELDLPCRPCPPKYACPHNIACLRQLPLGTINMIADRVLAEVPTASASIAPAANN